MNSRREDIKLQVLVCCYGEEGINRFASMSPPRVEGVEYLVSLQLPSIETDGSTTTIQKNIYIQESSQEEKDKKGSQPSLDDICLPSSILHRDDIRVKISDSRGLSKNRNLAMEMADAPYCLITDDDVDFGEGAGFKKIIATMQESGADIVCFKALCGGKEIKPYPKRLSALCSAPRGWYPISIEIAYRRESAAGKTAFDENYGIGSKSGLDACEEVVWIYDCEKRGAKVMISPEEICNHPSESTSERAGSEPWFVVTLGAMQRHIHPRTYLLRIMAQSLRQKEYPTMQYMRMMLNGAKKEIGIRN